MPKRIKILFTIPNFDTAGSGKVVYDLVQGLDSEKFEIEIACARKGGAFFKTVEALGYPIHIFDTKTHYKPYSTLLQRILAISKFFKKNKYDLIHSWQWSSDWTEALAAKFVGIKWIYTKKAMGFKSKHWKYKSYLADFIITINDEMQSYFPNKKKQQLIPLGLDLEYYNPKRFNFQPPVNKEDFKIIMVANLVHVKGLEVLLHAIKSLEDLSVKLSILGKCDNAYGKSMVQLTKDLGLENQVTFFGKQQDVRPFIVQSDLYIIPTLDLGRKEGMPMALVEAMSMGIPVLGSDISGINYVLKEFKNLLFEPSNSNLLASKIDYVKSLNIDERKKISNLLRTYSELHFSISKFVSTHESLYENLIKKGKGTS